MIDRRQMIAACAGAVLTSAFAVVAHQPAKRARIGVLGNENLPPWEGFRQGLSELGYMDGRNVTILWRWSEARIERFPALAKELVESNVDLIVASSTPAIRAAKAATSTIPIVMANSAYPDKSGLVDSLARPGGNVTGLTNFGPELAGKGLQILKELAPAVSRVAVLLNPENPVEVLSFKEVLAAAPGAGVEIQLIGVRTLDDYDAGFAAVAASRADAVLAFGNPANFRNRQIIADFALKSRLPSLYHEKLFVEAGGLVSYAPSYMDMYRRAATYVDKILKGANPATLPVEQPMNFELAINVRTARALGLTIPTSLQVLANQLIQ